MMINRNEIDENESYVFEMLPNCGQHTMRDGQVITPGMRVKCSLSDLGGAADKFEIVNTDKTPSINIPGKNDITSTLKIVHKGAGKYDVIRPDGKPINTVLLTHAEALALLNGVAGKDDETDENEKD